MHSGCGKFAVDGSRPSGSGCEAVEPTSPKCQEEIRAGDRNLGAIGIWIVFQVIGLV